MGHLVYHLIPTPCSPAIIHTPTATESGRRPSIPPDKRRSKSHPVPAIRLSETIVLLLNLRRRRLLLLPLRHRLLGCPILGLLLDEGSHFLLTCSLLLGSIFGGRSSWPSCGLARPNDLKSGRWSSASGSSRRPLHHWSGWSSRSSRTRWGSGGWSGRPGDRSGRRREEGCGMAGLRNGGRSRDRGQNALDRRMNLGSGEERSLSRCRRERSWWCREERCWRRREERCRWREEGRGGGQRSGSGSRPALWTLWSDDRVRIEKGRSSSWDRSDEEWSWFWASKKSRARPLIRGCSRRDQGIVLVCPAVAIPSTELAICQDEVSAHGYLSLARRKNDLTHNGFSRS